MPKNKNKQKIKKTGRHSPLKVLLQDLGGGLASLMDKPARTVIGRSLKGTSKDVRRGLGYVLARPIRTTLTLVTLVGLAILVSFFLPRKEGKINAHLENAQSSFEAKDYDAAIAEYETAFEIGGDIDASAYVNYIGALVGKGDDEKTREVLARLAPGPGNAPGIEEVHRLVAISHSNYLANSRPINLKHFKWHLDHSGKVDSTELNVAWARYKLAVGDVPAAVSFFQAAAADDPRYYAQVISYLEKLGQKELLEMSVTDARPKIEKLVKMNPKDDLSRVLYSRILFHLEAYDQSEQVLLQGLDETNSRTIKHACANFYLEQYLRTRKSSSFSESLGLLQKAFFISPESDGPTIELDQMYRSAKSSAEKAAIKSLLQAATEIPETALRAHTLLTSIFWRENKREEARVHAEKCYELDATSPMAANNLALQIFQSPLPELNRALELSRFAVGKLPKNAAFRDTLGTILMKMGSYQEATMEFEKALALNVQNPQAIHEKLAFNYDKLGFQELSQRHAESSKRAKE